MCQVGVAFWLGRRKTRRAGTIEGRQEGNELMAKQSLTKEFFLFIKEEKKWWLIPLISVLLLLAVLLVFVSSSPLAPFLYPLF